jgi:hypothetical protein
MIAKNVALEHWLKYPTYRMNWLVIEAVPGPRDRRLELHMEKEP